MRSKLLANQIEIDDQKNHAEEEQKIEREINHHQRLQHKNVVRLFGSHFVT